MCLISATAYRLQFSDQMKKTDRSSLCGEFLQTTPPPPKTPLYCIAINFRSILFLLVDIFPAPFIIQFNPNGRILMENEFLFPPYASHS